MPRYPPSSLTVRFTRSSASMALTHASHRLPTSGSGQARKCLSTRERRMIHGANATSTKDGRPPRKKGPVTWEALTRDVMPVWRVVVRVVWRPESCGGGLGALALVLDGEG